MSRPKTHVVAGLALFLLGVAVGVAIMRLGASEDDQRWFAALADVDFRVPRDATDPAPLSEDDPPILRLAVAGDVGRVGEAGRRTGEVMARFEDERSYDALILLGDNAYPDGDPELLRQTVFDPYEQVLDGSTTLVAALGNHDVEAGHGPDQVDALGMPARWYATWFDRVLLVTLDSNTPDDPDQLAWLDETLAEAGDDQWVIVAAHHPLYSGGWHGSSTAARDAWGELFDAHDVDLVLAGHEHDYQRTEPIYDITHVISGAASTVRFTGTKSYTEAAYSVYHFVDLLVWPDRLVGRAVDHRGRVFDEFVIDR